MPYLYLAVAVFTNSSASILGKAFNKRADGCVDGTAFYNVVQLTSVFALWSLLYAFDFAFEPSVLPYSLLFGVCYTLCMVGTIGSLKYGPAALSALFINLSLLITTVWGFFFWGEQIGVLVIVGMALVVLSVVLCLYSGRKEKETINLKWLLCIVLAVLGNAGCSIVQRTQ